MKGYAIVDRNNEEGKASQGFQKILSAVQKYEAYAKWAEENASDALTQVLGDMIPLTRKEVFKWRYWRGVKEPSLIQIFKDRTGCRWSLTMECFVGGNIKSSLISVDYLTDQESWGLDGDLEFVHQQKEYESLRNIIRNGEQFMLDEDLCKFVNFWNRKEVPR